MKRHSKVEKINTKYLTEAARDTYHTTNAGTDFGHRWEEIEAEILRRQSLQAEKDLREFQRQQREHQLHTQGRACTKCGTCYPLDALDSHFSKVSGSATRYRSACKSCQKAAAKEQRELKKIPF